MGTRRKPSPRQTTEDGSLLDRLTPRPGAQDGGFRELEANIDRALADPQTRAQLHAEVARLPSAAELTPPQLRQELEQVERQAAKALRVRGVTVREARGRVGVGYAGGYLGVYDTATARRKLLPETARLFVVLLELTRQGRLWLDHGLLKDAGRALMDARTVLAVAPYHGGQSKGGRAPKRRPGIWQHVLAKVTENPTITAQQVFTSFPVDEHRRETEGLIYRTWEHNTHGERVEKLVEVDDRTGKERSITYHAFRDYVALARKELRSK